MGNSGQDWLLVATSKFQGWISPKNYSPVIHDISARILIIIIIIYGLQGKLVDVEIAFLYGDLEEEVYMDCPEGMIDVKEDEALLLQSTIYGLVQSARQYYKKATKILKDLG